MKLLCTGDLHVGRRSSGLPSDDKHSCAAAWSRVVDEALVAKVDVVLLSGDLMDRDNLFFEAAGPLETGLRRLVDEEIHVCAVAGNHDFEALPQFFNPIAGEYLHLLGLDGRWESQIIERNGDKLRVVGWSFPSQHVSVNPLDSFQVEDDNIPTIGLLHCDVDSSDNKYAPTPLNDLKGKDNLSFWLIGHIHLPAQYDGDGPLVLNPGSPQAMHPNERGDHGPWIVELNGKTLSEPRQIITSTVKYCPMEVDISSYRIEEIKQSVLEEIRNLRKEQARDTDRVISTRIKITGKSDIYANIRKELSTLETATVNNVHIESITYETSRPLDLESLANGKSAAAVAAQVLLCIENKTLAQEHSDLLKNTLDKMRSVYEANAYVNISDNKSENEEDAPPDEQAAVDILYAQCTALLDALMNGDRK